MRDTFTVVNDQFYREKLCLVCVTGLSRGKFPVLIIHEYLK